MKIIIVVAFCITFSWARPQRFDQQSPIQEVPGSNFLPGNNTIGSSTTAAPVTTASPQYLACLGSCPSTMEYNPICGTDNQNYHNNGRLTCAQRCGKNVASLRGGTCKPL